jgi:alkylation response protein AidB-like acyl-CoA dehydrogenase
MRDLLGDIGVSEEQIEIANLATSFCRDKSSTDTARELIETRASHRPGVWDEISELGWLGIAVPEAYGGIGLSLAEVVPVMEQMGRTMMSGPFLSTTLAAQVLLKAGTEKQKAAWLPKLASGTRATLAVTELNSGHNPADISAHAKSEGDHLVLSGTKILVTDADSADLVVVSIRIDGDLTLALLDKSVLENSALRREIVIDETRASFAVTLDGVIIQKSDLLEPEPTEAAIMHLHLAANLLLAAEMCGGAQSCIDYTLDYLKTRKQFGKEIGAFQALKHSIVEAYCDFEKARSHLYSAAWCFNDPRRSEIAVRMAKAQADKAFSYAADRAIQFHGGFGFTYECDAQLYRRRALWCSAQHGDAAYHKAKLAELLLR